MNPDTSAHSAHEACTPATEPFVEDVHVGEKRERNRRAERILVAGWALVCAKSAVVWWACFHYATPFHPMWIVGPTVAFASLCTGVYLFARR